MKATLLAAAGFVLFATAAAPFARAQMPGGWSKASVKDQGVVDAAKFAVKAQQEAAKGGGQGEKLVLVKILGAQQQVVQGMNYKLTLRVKMGETVKSAEAVVWARVWLKCDDQYKLTSWKLVDAPQPKPAPPPKPASKAAPPLDPS